MVVMKRCFLLLVLAGTLLWGGAVHADGTEPFQKALARALVFEAAGKYSEAVAALREALALDPRRTDVLVRVAVVQARSGDPKGAEQTLRQILAREPLQADALRELGALLLATDRRGEAVSLLERAAALRPKEGATQYYLGLAREARGENEAARDAFSLAARLAPELASQSSYEIATIYLREGQPEAARAHLEAAIRAASDRATVVLARRELEGLRAKPAPRPWWHLVANFGLVYDSNVALLPDLTGEIPGTTGVGAETAPSTGAARVSADLVFEGRPLEGRHTVGLGASLFQSKHLPAHLAGDLAPPTFDLTTLGFYAYYALRAQWGSLPVRFEVAGGHQEMLLDLFGEVRHYRSAPWLRPSITLAYRPWGAVRLAYRFGYENYDNGNAEGTADDRDAWQHLVSLEKILVLGGRLDLRLTLLAGTSTADGSRWEVVVAGAALDAEVRPWPWLALGAGVASLHRDYLSSKYPRVSLDLQIREVQRVDDSVFAFARARFLLGRIYLGLTYTYMRNNSSMHELFSFRRHLAGMEVGFRI
jgi:Flp pilus assembly protein TadD